MPAVDELKRWFKGLQRKDQEEVLEYLYDKVLLREGAYCGPHPQLVTLQKGLFCGPAPQSQTRNCPTCGKPM